MANKQKPPLKGQSKRIQNENSQRNVNIIKHFEPNIHCNTNHLNCDLPEIDVDVDTRETSYKKNTPPITKANVNKYQDVPNAREQSNMNVKEIRKNHTTKLVSRNKEYMSNSSSSSRNIDSTMLKNFTSMKSLMIPTIRSSISSSITTSSRSSSNKKKIQKKKSKTCSFSSKQSDDNIMDSLRDRYGKGKDVSTSSVSMTRNLVLDLKKEITDSRLQNPVLSKKNNAVNSRSETVEQLRDEIKNIINTNLFDKRKHLAEIKAEISNFRNSGDILVYGVNIDNNEFKSSDKESVENISNGRYIKFNNKETNQCCHPKRCRKTLQYRKSKSKSPSGSNKGTTGLEDDRALSLKVNEGFMKCLDYPGTDDKIRAKIDRTNSLIYKLQHTLDRIRYRSQLDASVLEVTTTDSETGKTISGTSKSDEEIASNQATEDKITVEVEPGIENVLSSKLSVVPYNETVISLRKPPLDLNEENTDHEESKNIINSYDKAEYESSRPKTRRNSAPGGVCNLDRFQNTPKVEEKTVLSSDTDLRVLQAKLNTISEQTESDLSFSSDNEPVAKEEVEVSLATSASETTLKDFIIASSPTTSMSVQCGNSPELANEQPQKFEISSKPLQKTTQLVVQLLPPVNITRGPAPQKLICISINSLGKTSLQYKSDSQNVGYYQIDSPSLTQLRPSGQNKNQGMVNFIGVSEITKPDLSQEIKSKETNAAEPTSEINYLVLDELNDDENKQDGTPASISLPEKVLTQTKCSPQSQQQSEKIISDLTEIYDEHSENHICDDLYNAESSATIERINTSDVRRIPKISLCDPKESSSFNLIDAAQEEERQRLKRNRQKSVSDPNIHETIYGEHQRNMKRGISRALEKDLIFKSFQLFKNYIDHDPGSLSNLSTDLISNMDESVYKTYINPSGFHRHNLQGSTSNKDKKGPATLTKMSSLKFVIPGSPKKQYEGADVDKETKNQCSPATEPSENDSKVYNIGLYSSKSTQSTHPLDEVAMRLKQLSKEYIPEVISETSINKPATPENISYENISLTLSYSTDESSDSSADQEHEVHVVEPVKSKDVVIEIKEKKPKAPFVENPQDVKKFKQLKKKINEEHNIVPSDSHIDLSRIDFSSDSISASIPAFITGLITSNPNELQKVIPLMRKTVQGAKRKLSIARTPTEKAEDATDAEESSNKTYTVLPVHPISVNPLQAGRNGRYKDEENIFCENNYPRMEETLERKFDYRPGNLHRREHRIDSSNSDTITSERTLSEGEIRCCCSASIGEMHRCEAKKVVNHRKSSPPQKEEKISIRKRKTYFNNLVTFYHNTNASLVNDSSSTS